MTTDAGTSAERRRVRQLLGRAGVAILVTVDECGASTGRPMLPLFVDDDPSIYFLTHHGSRKVAQIIERPQILLAISSPHYHIVVAGHAHASRDSGLIRRLWHPTYRAWFPDGKDDRDAAVLRVEVERVDYWEPPHSSVQRAFQAIKALLSHQPVETPRKTVDRLDG